MPAAVPSATSAARTASARLAVIGLFLLLREPEPPELVEAEQERGDDDQAEPAEAPADVHGRVAEPRDVELHAADGAVERDRPLLDARVRVALCDDVRAVAAHAVPQDAV